MCIYIYTHMYNTCWLPTVSIETSRAFAISKITGHCWSHAELRTFWPSCRRWASEIPRIRSRVDGGRYGKGRWGGILRWTWDFYGGFHGGFHGGWMVVEWDFIRDFIRDLPLVNVEITMESHHATTGKTHYCYMLWPFSIAMLNYQRA